MTNVHLNSLLQLSLPTVRCGGHPAQVQCNARGVRHPKATLAMP